MVMNGHCTISASELLKDARCQVHLYERASPAPPTAEFKHGPVPKEGVWPQLGTAPHLVNSKPVM